MRRYWFLAGVIGLVLSDATMYIRMMGFGSGGLQAVSFWIGAVGAAVGYIGWTLWLTAAARLRTGEVGRGALIDGMLIGISLAAVFGLLVISPQVGATGANVDQIWFLGCLIGDAVLVWLAMTVLMTGPADRRSQLILLGLTLHVGVDILHSVAFGQPGFWRMRIAEIVLLATYAAWVATVRTPSTTGRAGLAGHRVARLRSSGLALALTSMVLILTVELGRERPVEALIFVAVMAIFALLVTSRIKNLIVDLAATHAQLAHQAQHDHLTGLWNRSALADYVAERESSAELRAVIYLDLDRFKAVNDTYGHDAGDEVLIEVANRIRRAVRGSDEVARIGGDEFVVVVTDADTDVPAFIARLDQVINNTPLEWQGQVLDVGVSVGVARWPEPPPDDATPSFEWLLAEADSAMFDDKRERHAAGI